LIGFGLIRRAPLIQAHALKWKINGSFILVAVELAGHTLQPSTVMVMEDSVPGTSSEKRAMWS